MSEVGLARLGLRVFTQIHRPEPAALALLAHASSCEVADAMRGAGVVDSDIHATYSPMGRIFGPAITVDLSPGDGMMLRAAIDVAQAGDVIVANAHGVTSRAILGGTVGMHMVHRGIKGLVVDGAVRDVQEFRALGLPVMARAVTPRSGTSASGWGEVNVPVACGGAVVMPGDLVMGDEEGLVIVPRLWVARVAAGLRNTGHGAYQPASIRAQLGQLAPDARVDGIALVQRALTEREGSVIEGSYEATELKLSLSNR